MMSEKYATACWEPRYLHFLLEKPSGPVYELMQADETGTHQIGRIDTHKNGHALLLIKGNSVVRQPYPSLEGALHAARNYYGFSGCYVSRVKEYQ